MQLNRIVGLPQHGNKSIVTNLTVGLPRPLPLQLLEAAKVRARHEKAHITLTHTAGIEKLPPELMDTVLKDVDSKDVLNLRSTSRSIQALTWPHAAKHCFSTIRVPLTEEGYDHVATLIAENREFRNSITKIIFEAGAHIPSDADNIPLTRKERNKLNKAMRKEAKVVDARRQELELAADVQDLRDEADGITSVVQDPDYIRPREWHRGRSMPTSSLKNADMHTGRLYGAVVIRKCLGLLPSITDITIYHNVDGIKERDRQLWVSDHCTASAEAEALLSILAERPMPNLKRLHMGSSCFGHNLNEGLIMLSNLHNISARKLAALAPTLANLEHFGLSVNTNTLDGVSETAYASVSRLLRLMPNLKSLGLAASKRSRRVYPTQLFREICINVSRFRSLEHLAMCDWPIEQPVLEAFVGKHLATLQTLKLDHARIYGSFTPCAANVWQKTADWPTFVEELKAETQFRVVEMELEYRDDALVRKLAMRRETAETEENMSEDGEETEDEDMMEA
ncbi:putative f-box domain cyclin-like protein [Diplodia seriata]|uniref:Putative f-box domain cyclin-like protein n=1 Tax=Diplodia seriata TaxID=420778 RepID=A0A0G2GEJ6_9PEZI|nr:putative f-box domain cyclin-like protein [Diplodia seriata]